MASVTVETMVPTFTHRAHPTEHRQGTVRKVTATAAQVKAAALVAAALWFSSTMALFCFVLAVAAALRLRMVPMEAAAAARLPTVVMQVEDFQVSQISLLQAAKLMGQGETAGLALTVTELARPVRTQILATSYLVILLIDH